MRSRTSRWSSRSSWTWIADGKVRFRSPGRERARRERDPHRLHDDHAPDDPGEHRRRWRSDAAPTLSGGRAARGRAPPGSSGSACARPPSSSASAARRGHGRPLAAGRRPDRPAARRAHVRAPGGARRAAAPPPGAAARPAPPVVDAPPRRAPPRRDPSRPAPAGAAGPIFMPPATKRLELRRAATCSATAASPQVRLGGRPLAVAEADDDRLVVELPEAAAAGTLEVDHGDGDVDHVRAGVRRPLGAGGDVTVERPGYTVFTLRTGEALENVPAHARLPDRRRPRRLAARPRAARPRAAPPRRRLPRRGRLPRPPLAQRARASSTAASTTSRRSSACRAPTASGSPTRARPPWVIDRLRVAADRRVGGGPDAGHGAVRDRRRGAAAPPRRARSARRTRWCAPPEALALEPGDERVTVACVDSGVALGHAELQRKLLAGFDSVDIGIGAVGRELRLVGDSRGHDFAPLDDVGHGTHVAGVIGAQGWRMPKGLGGLALDPAAARAGRARGRRTASRPVGVGALPDIDAGMKIAVDLGAHVINMSFGTRAEPVAEGAPSPHQPVVELRDAVRLRARRRLRQQRAARALLPGGAARRDRGRLGRPRGAAARASARPATTSRSWRRASASYSADRRGYRAASGTSFAAPFVAAAAALLMARRRAAGPAPAHVPARSVAPSSRSARNGVLDAAAALHRIDAQEASP